MVILLLAEVQRFNIKTFPKLIADVKQVGQSPMPTDFLLPMVRLLNDIRLWEAHQTTS